MKKIILLALAALIMMGCRYEYTDKNIVEATNSVIVVNKHTLDSCEYYPQYGHKGDCKYCEERDSLKWEKRKKELEELVIKLKEK